MTCCSSELGQMRFSWSYSQGRLPRFTSTTWSAFSLPKIGLLEFQYTKWVFTDETTGMSKAVIMAKTSRETLAMFGLQLLSEHPTHTSAQVERQSTTEWRAGAWCPTEIKLAFPGFLSPSHHHTPPPTIPPHRQSLYLFLYAL